MFRNFRNLQFILASQVLGVNISFAANSANIFQPFFGPIVLPLATGAPDVRQNVS
jgi:hypothetical protein